MSQICFKNFSFSFGIFSTEHFLCYLTDSKAIR
jgi:hypothetical protein